jgi:hypothetical protein
MTSRSNFSIVCVAICVAGYIAGTLGSIAHDHLGFSTEHIRDVAVASATVIASLLAIDHFGKKFRKERGDHIDG